MNTLKFLSLLLILALCLSAEPKIFRKKQTTTFVLIEKLQNAKGLIDDVIEAENKLNSTVANKLDMAITRLYYAQLAIIFDDDLKQSEQDANQDDDDAKLMINFLQGIESLVDEAKSELESNSTYVTDLEIGNQYIQEVERVFLLHAKL